MGLLPWEMGEIDIGHLYMVPEFLCPRASSTFRSLCLKEHISRDPEGKGLRWRIRIRLARPQLYFFSSSNKRDSKVAKHSLDGFSYLPTCVVRARPQVQVFRYTGYSTPPFSDGPYSCSDRTTDNGAWSRAASRGLVTPLIATTTTDLAVGSLAIAVAIRAL